MLNEFGWKYILSDGNAYFVYTAVWTSGVHLLSDYKT